MLRTVVERTLRAQQPQVTAHIAKIRRKDPDATPAQVIAQLNRRYQLVVAGLGAAGGGIAIVPAVGTAVSLATATAEAVAALDAAVLYTLAVAEVHRVSVDDVERLGHRGRHGRGRNRADAQGHRWEGPVGPHRHRDPAAARAGPVNNTLTRWFVKRYVTRQLALAVGRALPFGLGVIIGAVGNVVAARTVIAAAERAFGLPPARWPEEPVLAAARGA
jgi:hypothetical protein